MKPNRIAAFSFFAALTVAPAAFAQEDFSKAEIKTEKLADTVFMMDDQFAPLTPKIKAAIAKVTKKPVKFLLNTHWHFDHVGGNENMGKAGVLIFAHENVRKRMSSEQFIEFLGMKTKPDPKIALPIVTFTSEVTFHVNGDEVRAFHVDNAHTDGDTIVHFTKRDRKSTRLNSSHMSISYAVFCLK